MAENAFTPEFVARQVAKVRQKAAPAVQAAPEADVPHETAKRTKYGNTPVLVAFKTLEYVSGHQRMVHTFDSGREATRYQELCLLRFAGQIADLRLQEPFLMLAHGADGQPVPFGEWFADFVYQDTALGLRIIEDVKSADAEKVTKTAMYKLKKKIIEACHGFSITEV